MTDRDLIESLLFRAIGSQGSFEPPDVNAVATKSTDFQSAHVNLAQGLGAGDVRDDLEA